MLCASFILLVWCKIKFFFIFLFFQLIISFSIKRFLIVQFVFILLPFLELFLNSFRFLFSHTLNYGFSINRMEGLVIRKTIRPLGGGSFEQVENPNSPKKPTAVFFVLMVMRLHVVRKGLNTPRRFRITNVIDYHRQRNDFYLSTTHSPTVRPFQQSVVV